MARLALEEAAVRFAEDAPVVGRALAVPVEGRAPALAVEGQPGSWYWANDAVKAERFDGSMRVIVAGKTYTSPLTTVWT